MRPPAPESLFSRSWVSQASTWFTSLTSVLPGGPARTATTPRLVLTTGAKISLRDNMKVLVYIEWPRSPIPLFLFLCPPPLSPCLVFGAGAFPSVLTVAEHLRVRSDDCEEGPRATKTTEARGLATFSLMWKSQIIPSVICQTGSKDKDCV